MPYLLPSLLQEPERHAAQLLGTRRAPALVVPVPVAVGLILVVGVQVDIF